MESKNRNKTIHCKFCKRSMRSDTLKRHLKSKNCIPDNLSEVYEMNPTNTTNLLTKEINLESKNSAKEENKQVNDFRSTDYFTLSTKDNNLEEEMIKNNCKYKEKIEMGERIGAIIDDGTVFEGSLSKKHEKALHLYREQKPRTNTTNVDLRSWQKDLMDKMARGNSDRNVYWIHGHKGNEGKSWMQSYIESCYGHARVVQLEIRNSTSDILFTLSKHPLQSTDIFLFNDTRSNDRKPTNYEILELIKDGSAASTKYNCEVLKFKTPNTVIVFSNYLPFTEKLSKDRWRINTIGDDGLKLQ